MVLHRPIEITRIIGEVVLAGIPLVGFARDLGGLLTLRFGMGGNFSRTASCSTEKRVQFTQAEVVEVSWTALRLTGLLMEGIVARRF